MTKILVQDAFLLICIFFFRIEIDFICPVSAIKKNITQIHCDHLFAHFILQTDQVVFITAK